MPHVCDVWITLIPKINITIWILQWNLNYLEVLLGIIGKIEWSMLPWNVQTAQYVMLGGEEVADGWSGGGG